MKRRESNIFKQKERIAEHQGEDITASRMLKEEPLVRQPQQTTLFTKKRTKKKKNKKKRKHSCRRVHSSAEQKGL